MRTPGWEQRPSNPGPILNWWAVLRCLWKGGGEGRVDMTSHWQHVFFVGKSSAFRWFQADFLGFYYSYLFGRVYLGVSKLWAPEFPMVSNSTWNDSMLERVIAMHSIREKQFRLNLFGKYGHFWKDTNVIAAGQMSWKWYYYKSKNPSPHSSWCASFHVMNSLKMMVAFCCIHVMKIILVKVCKGVIKDSYARIDVFVDRIETHAPPRPKELRDWNGSLKHHPTYLQKLLLEW